jgi:hypothetical protein
MRVLPVVDLFVRLLKVTQDVRSVAQATHKDLLAFVFVFIPPRRSIASWRMYPNACGYVAPWSTQNNSHAEFFMSVMDGSR